MNWLKNLVGGRGWWILPFKVRGTVSSWIDGQTCSVEHPDERGQRVSHGMKKRTGDVWRFRDGTPASKLMAWRLNKAKPSPAADYADRW